MPLQGAGAYDPFSLNGTWQLFDSLQPRAGIDNLLDRQPEVVGAQTGLTNAPGQSVPGFYERLGRSYYIGLKSKLQQTQEQAVRGPCGAPAQAPPAAAWSSAARRVPLSQAPAGMRISERTG